MPSFTGKASQEIKFAKPEPYSLSSKPASKYVYLAPGFTGGFSSTQIIGYAKENEPTMSLPRSRRRLWQSQPSQYEKPFIFLGGTQEPNNFVLNFLFILLFSFQFPFFLWIKLGLFLVFPFAFIFFPFIAHICFSFLENNLYLLTCTQQN